MDPVAIVAALAGVGGVVVAIIALVRTLKLGKRTNELAARTTALTERTTELAELYAPRPALAFSVTPGATVIATMVLSDDGEKTVSYAHRSPSVRITNNGNGPAHSIVVVVRGSIGQAKRIEVGYLPPGESREVSVSLTSSEGDPGEVDVEWRHHPSPETFRERVAL